MSCLRPGNVELMERYLQEELPAGEVEAFENHVLECDDCAAELETLAALRIALANRREAIEDHGEPEQSFSGRIWMALAAALLLAVGLVLVLQPWSQSDLASLASIEPPAYRESRLRGPVDDADQRFRAGMERYQQADYRGAVSDLEAALTLDPSRVDIAFYLGATHLLIGDVQDSLENLERVIAPGDTPFLEEALYLRAQAHLLAGDAAAAEGDLRSILELEGDWRDRAQSQIDQLQALVRGDE